MSGGDPVRYERTGAAALVTIDRPDRRNAVDGRTAELLHDALGRFEADPEARVMVLTGAGEEAFCAGADLKALETLNARLDLDEGPLGISRLAATKPTLAAVSGWCLAGGLELALWCDLRIAAEGSTFGFAERRWGVPLIDGGTQRLPRIVGLGRALEMVLTGRMVSAAEAQATGLVTEVVAPGRHVERALEIAEALAAFPQETMLSDRQAVYQGIGAPLAEGLRREAEIGVPSAAVGERGARRFAGGEGRGGTGLAR